MVKSLSDKRETMPAVVVKKIISYLSALFTPTFVEAFFLIIIYLSLANYLNIKAVGTLSCILAVNFCVLAVFDLGVSEAAAILVGRYFAEHPKMNGVIYKTYIVVIVQILLACVFLVTLAPWISRYVIHEDLATLIRCTVLWLPPLFLTRYYNGLFKGFGKFRFAVFPVLVSEMLKIEVVVIAITFQKGLLFIINGWTICYAVSGGFYFYLVQRSLFGEERQKERIENMPYMEIFREGRRVIWQTLSASFAWFIILLLSMFFSPNDLGFFAICYHVPAFSFLFLAPLTENMYLPLFNACERRDVENIKRLFRMIVKYTSFFAYIVLAAWMFWGENVLGFFGASAAANSKVLDVIVLGMFFGMLGRLFDPILHVFGEGVLVERIEYGKLAVFASISLWALPDFSVFFAGILLSALFLCSAFLKFVRLEKLYDINIAKELESFIWLPVILLPLYFISAPFLLFISVLVYWLVTEKAVTMREYRQVFMSS